MAVLYLYVEKHSRDIRYLLDGNKLNVVVAILLYSAIREGYKDGLNFFVKKLFADMLCYYDALIIKYTINVAATIGYVAEYGGLLQGI